MLTSTLVASFWYIMSILYIDPSHVHTIKCISTHRRNRKFFDTSTSPTHGRKIQPVHKSSGLGV